MITAKSMVWSWNYLELVTNQQWLSLNSAERERKRNILQRWLALPLKSFAKNMSWFENCGSWRWFGVWATRTGKLMSRWFVIRRFAAFLLTTPHWEGRQLMDTQQNWWSGGRKKALQRVCYDLPSNVEWNSLMCGDDAAICCPAICGRVNLR